MGSAFGEIPVKPQVIPDDEQNPKNQDDIAMRKICSPPPFWRLSAWQTWQQDRCLDLENIGVEHCGGRIHQSNKNPDPPPGANLRGAQCGAENGGQQHHIKHGYKC